MAKSLFEQATRTKFRFASCAGNLNVEDLWDLPLTSERTNRASLNEVAKLLYLRVKDNEEVSFVTTPSVSNTTDVAKLELVKHIIAVRIEENAAKSAAAATAQQNARIRELIGKKKDEVLSGKSIEELEKLLG